MAMLIVSYIVSAGLGCGGARVTPPAGFEIYRVMRFSGIKLGAGINQNW